MKASPPHPEREKLAALQALAEQDAAHPHVREAAATIVDLVRHQLQAHDRDRMIAQLCHSIARDGIRYQLDTQRTGGEDIAGLTRPEAHPFEAIRRGVDDCDAKARLFVALARACGLRAEILPLWRGEQLQHVFARVQIAGAWMPVELTLARAVLGDEPHAVPWERERQDWRRT